MYCVNAESVGGEDNSDSDPESSRHLPLVWSWKERTGECVPVWWNSSEGINTTHSHLTQGTQWYFLFLLFCRLEFRVMTANTQVLIQVIRLSSNHDLSHRFGAIGCSVSAIGLIGCHAKSQTALLWLPTCPIFRIDFCIGISFPCNWQIPVKFDTGQLLHCYM